MFCTAVVAGTVVANYFFGKVIMQSAMGTEREKTLKVLYGVSGVVLIISGFLNIFLVRGNTDMKKYPLWKQIVYFKFFVSPLTQGWSPYFSHF